MLGKAGPEGWACAHGRHGTPLAVCASAALLGTSRKDPALLLLLPSRYETVDVSVSRAAHSLSLNRQGDAAHTGPLPAASLLPEASRSGAGGGQALLHTSVNCRGFQIFLGHRTVSDPERTSLPTRRLRLWPSPALAPELLANLLKPQRSWRAGWGLTGPAENPSSEPETSAAGALPARTVGADAEVPATAERGERALQRPRGPALGGSCEHSHAGSALQLAEVRAGCGGTQDPSLSISSF